MSDTERVRVLRPFNKRPGGDLAEVGEVLTVERLRADALKRLGLAEEAEPAPESKQKPAPANKMTPTPASKRRTRE